MAKQHKAHELDMITLTNHAARSYMTWYMSHYTMIYKNGERIRDFLTLFVFIMVFDILGAFLIKQLFHSWLLDTR